MSKEKAQKGVSIVAENGSTMMLMERFGREGDRMTVQGSLMGAWSTKMYIEPEDVPHMLGMLINGPVIAFILSLPFILIKRRKKKTV